MPTIKQLSRIFSSDDALNRVQDQLASALNPILRHVKGDLAGPLESPTVAGLQGVPIANVTPTSGQVLGYNGTQWTPVAGGGGAVTAVTATYPLSSSGGTTPNISLDTALSGILHGTYPSPDGLNFGSSGLIPVFADASLGTVSGTITTSTSLLATGTFISPFTWSGTNIISGVANAGGDARVAGGTPGGNAYAGGDAIVIGGPSSPTALPVRPPLVGDEELAYFFENSSLPTVNHGTFGAAANLVSISGTGVSLGVPGIFGKATSFDGTASQGLYTFTYGSTPIPGNDFTVTCVCKPTGYGTVVQMPIGTGGAVPYVFLIEVYSFPWGPGFVVRADGGGKTLYQNYVPITLGNTYVVSMVLDYTAMSFSFYLNGAPIITQMYGSMPPTYYTPQKGIFVGNKVDLSSPWPGEIYDLRFVSAVRSDVYLAGFAGAVFGSYGPGPAGDAYLIGGEVGTTAQNGHVGPAGDAFVLGGAGTTGVVGGDAYVRGGVGNPTNGSVFIGDANTKTVSIATAAGGSTLSLQSQQVDLTTTPPTTDQVLTYNGTKWVPATVSMSSVAAVYGAYVNTDGPTTIPIAPLNPIAVTYDTIEGQSGVTLVGGSGGSQIQVAKAGIYEFSFSPQMQHSGGSASTISMWLRLNGSSPVPRSNSDVKMSNNTDTIFLYVSVIVSLSAGDYVEWLMSSDGGSATTFVSLAGTGGTGPYDRPLAPAIITGVKLLGT